MKIDGIMQSIKKEKREMERREMYSKRNKRWRWKDAINLLRKIRNVFHHGFYNGISIESILRLRLTISIWVY